VRLKSISVQSGADGPERASLVLLMVIA
jgi:hypothetical protein